MNLNIFYWLQSFEIAISMKIQIVTSLAYSCIWKLFPESFGHNPRRL